MKNFCKTAKEVVTALDGPGGVRRLTGATNKQIWHWHSRAGTFPANHY